MLQLLAETMAESKDSKNNAETLQCMMGNRGKDCKRMTKLRVQSDQAIIEDDATSSRWPSNIVDGRYKIAQSRHSRRFILGVEFKRRHEALNVRYRTLVALRGQEHL